MSERELPEWAKTATVTTNSTAPLRWVPCSQCQGSGGGFHNVLWSLRPVWVSCVICLGGAGRFQP